MPRCGNIQGDRVTISTVYSMALALQLLISVYVIMASLMVFAWLASIKHNNAGFGDVAWSMGMGFSALFYGASGDGSLWLRLLVALLGGVWAARLALHQLARLLNEPESPRYREFRDRWGDSARYRFFFLFQVQALGASLCSMPFLMVAMYTQASPQWTTYLGVAIWLTAIAGETLSDFQLARFRLRHGNRSKTCKNGLWRYSRHPNYFFEGLHWVAYVFLAYGMAFWWLTLTGPVVVLLLLCRVTGIPAVERQALRSRGSDYEHYRNSTSMLVPWFPQRKSNRNT